jgi:F-type H+-transporting ATPase subunit b
MIQILTILANTAPAEEAQGIAALGIDPLAILAQGATFLLFFLIIKKFAFGKVVDTLEKRRKTIEQSLDKAESLTKQNEEAEVRVNELLHQARKDAEEIINKSHEEAGAIVQEAEEKAGVKAEKIVADGKIQIEQQVIKAQEQLKKDTLELVSLATSALLGEKVDAKKHEALVKKALSESKK